MLGVRRGKNDGLKYYYNPKNKARVRFFSIKALLEKQRDFERIVVFGQARGVVFLQDQISAAAEMVFVGARENRVFELKL